MKTAMPLLVQRERRVDALVHDPQAAMAAAGRHARWPTPVAASFGGRNAMIDGLWTLRTVSPSICSGSPLRASEPGAPFGHSTMVGCPGGMTTAGGLGAAGAAAAGGVCGGAAAAGA